MARYGSIPGYQGVQRPALSAGALHATGKTSLRRGRSAAGALHKVVGPPLQVPFMRGPGIGVLALALLLVLGSRRSTLAPRRG